MASLFFVGLAPSLDPEIRSSSAFDFRPACRRFLGRSAFFRPTISDRFPLLDEMEQLIWNGEVFRHGEEATFVSSFEVCRSHVALR